MTINADPHSRMYHMRLKCQPNTPEEQIGAFWMERGEFRCEAYNCTMTREACAERKALAKEKEKENGYNVYKLCLECEGAKKMDPKKCHVDGCGKKVLAKGMCTAHYFKARKEEKRDKGETKTPTPETKQPIAETKAPEPEKQPDPPKAPESKTAQASPETVQTKIIPKIIPEKKPNGTKRVNVEFRGEDVALWEKLRNEAKKARRDIRIHALYIIEQWLSTPEG